MNLQEFIGRLMKWSLETFGAGNKRESILDHITQELEEIRQNPKDVYEWIDVVILALDGAWRAGFTPDQIAAALLEKQKINEFRRWPNPEDFEPGKAINHLSPKEL